MKNQLNQKKINENTSSPDIFSDVLNKPVTDCDHMKKYKNVATLTRDYLEFAFAEECWGEKLFKSADSAIADLKKSFEIVDSIS